MKKEELQELLDKCLTCGCAVYRESTVKVKILSVGYTDYETYCKLHAPKYSEMVIRGNDVRFRAMVYVNYKGEPIGYKKK